MEQQIDTSEFVEVNRPDKSWVRQPLHRNQNLYNRLIRALVADNAEDKFRFLENHPEITRNIKNRIYKKPGIRCDMIIEEFLGKYTEQILDDCAAFRRNNELWLSCPKLPESKLWKKKPLYLNNNNNNNNSNKCSILNKIKKRDRDTMKLNQSESEYYTDNESPPELSAETYDFMEEQQPKKKRISSPTMPGISGSKSDVFKVSSLYFSNNSGYPNNNSFTKRSESTVTKKLTQCQSEDMVDLGNSVRSVEPDDNTRAQTPIVARKPKSTWLDRLENSKENKKTTESSLNVNNDADKNNNNNNERFVKNNHGDDNVANIKININEVNKLKINDVQLLLGDDILSETAMHCLLDYYYNQQKDDQFRACFKIMPSKSSFNDLQYYQKSYRAKLNSDEYIFICIEENKDFYGIILKRMRHKNIFDERVVVLNSNHRYENKYLIKIIQELQKFIPEIDYYSELDYPHQLNGPVSNIYLVYFFKWLTVENLEKLFDDEPCSMPLALTKKNLEILKKDYAKIIYNSIPQESRALSNLGITDFD